MRGGIILETELYELSKAWSTGTYSLVTGQLKLRKVCTKQETSPHSDLVDDYGDGISYHEVLLLFQYRV